MIIPWDWATVKETYAAYRNGQFNKWEAKARNLSNAINKTHLTHADKSKLRNKLKDLI